MDTLLAAVKLRLGIYYDDANNDQALLQTIQGAIIYFSGAGWTLGESPSALGVEAVTLYCKMALNTDPAAFVNHPVLLSFIAQGRNEMVEVDP